MRFTNVFHGATVIHRVDYGVVGTWWVFFVLETLLYWFADPVERRVSEHRVETSNLAACVDF